MYKVFLHIGLHRTGTTAIQYFLADNAQRLEDAAITVANAGTPPGLRGNHELAWACLPRSQSESCWRDLDAELARRHGKRMIVSSEEFSRLDNKGIRFVAEFFRERGVELHVIVYLRNQVDLAESYYRIVVSHYEERRSLRQFMGDCASEYRLDYLDLLNNWADAVGRDFLHVRLWEKSSLPDGIIPDFCALTGIPFDEKYSKPLQNINHGLPFTALVPLTWMRRHGVNRDVIDRYLSWAETAYYDPRGPQIYLDKESAANFMSRFAVSNQAVAEQYFGRSSGQLFTELAQRPSDPPDDVTIAMTALTDFVASDLIKAMNGNHGEQVTPATSAPSLGAHSEN
jgi:hypothetical protein